MTDIFSTVIALLAMAISIHNAFKDRKVDVAEDSTNTECLANRVQELENFQTTVMNEKVSKILNSIDESFKNKKPKIIIINKNYEVYVRKSSNDKLKSMNESLWFRMQLVGYLEGDITFENVEVIFKNIPEDYKLYYGE